MSKIPSLNRAEAKFFRQMDEIATGVMASLELVGYHPSLLHKHPVGFRRARRTTRSRGERRETEDRFGVSRLAALG